MSMLFKLPVWKGGLKSWLQNANRNICAASVHILKSTVRAVFEFWQRFPYIFDTILVKNKNIPPIGIEPYAENARWLSSPPS